MFLAMKIDIWAFAESTLSAIEYLSLVMIHTGGDDKTVRKYERFGVTVLLRRPYTLVPCEGYRTLLM